MSINTPENTFLKPPTYQYPKRLFFVLIIEIPPREYQNPPARDAGIYLSTYLLKPFIISENINIRTH